MATELLFRSDAYLQTTRAQVVAADERGLALDRTICDPLGGGEPGDTGTVLRANGERIAIADTRKGEAIDSVLHVPAPSTPRPQIGETLTLEIDWPRRYALMRLHTALHVMSCVVVAPVTGGNNSAPKAPLEFGIDKSLPAAARIAGGANGAVPPRAETANVCVSRT